MQMQKSSKTGLQKCFWKRNRGGLALWKAAKLSIANLEAWKQITCRRACAIFYVCTSKKPPAQALPFGQGEPRKRLSTRSTFMNASR